MMRTTGGVLLVAVVLAFGACARTESNTFLLRPGDLLIQDVAVVSLERLEPAPHSHVVIRDGRIVWVGVAPRPAGRVTAIEGTGKFLVPGLIDGHVQAGVVLQPVQVVWSPGNVRGNRA